ncbi:MAG: 16S rRNA (cytidine(1402)-2'-O)-methyltransferase [Alphaproteobacteria bacterium 41-28]|nr:MAG: 16S rRNA (cytidine(1402)-2'-O)-methyltransferase [Alphaproteobacteria bacterium 41-28]
MLYLVATPIGNLKDITLRALETLKEVDVIACEDKRVSSKLLNHYGISKPLLSYHDHNAEQVRPRLLARLKEGKKVAYITDGGMPLISDPGFKLVVACQKEQLPYTVIPGPSAPLTALCLSGLSPDRFFFCGFLPPKQRARKAALEDIKGLQFTLLFFESPQRTIAFLKDALDVFGDREGAICREMTKLFEEVQKGLLSHLISHFEAHPPRGEVVIVIEGMSSISSFREADLEAHLERALGMYSVKEAVDLVSKALGLSKREVYQRALSLKSEKTSLS